MFYQNQYHMLRIIKIHLLMVIGIIQLTAQSEAFSVTDLFNFQSANGAVISPDGQHIAYRVSVQRPLSDGPGSNYTELHVYDFKKRESLPFITGDVHIGSLSWHPDGEMITWLAKDEKSGLRQVHGISIHGGAERVLTKANKTMLSYAWSPDGSKVAFVTLADGESWLPKGFSISAQDEDWRHRDLYMLSMTDQSSKKLTDGVTVFDMEWNPDSKRIALQIAPRNTVDDSYMFKRIYLLDTKTRELMEWVNNPGKLGNMAWNPSGTKLAFVSAVDISDPASSSLYYTNVGGFQDFGKLRNYSKGFEGTVTSAEWLDDNTMLFTADESVQTTLSKQGINDPNRTIIIDKGDTVFNGFSKSENTIAFTGSSASHPGEVFTYDLISRRISKKTDLNPWLASRKMGMQEKMSWTARDGLDLEGILIYPADYQRGAKYPLITLIHGGPEAAMLNGWQTYYSRWGQVAANRGYFVFMPNYRASTGRGVEFSKMDQTDLGDEEFTDVLDGIDYLIGKGMVDRNKVGIGGGSYGGYFAALAATKHTGRFQASVMFVGISNMLSKRNLTDIPYEDYYVHWKIWNNDDPDLMYERSPVAYTKSSKTPLLILHGDSDPRVHPSQSLEMYRSMEMHGNAPVRLIWYTGEGHGNRKNTNRMDYHIRTMRWFDYYLKGEGKTDELPPLKIQYE